MLIWIVLLVFAVPLVTVIMQSDKANKADNDRLDEIQKRLAEKRQQSIDSKLESIKEKNRKYDSK